MSSNEETKTETDADELGALAAELPVDADEARAAREQDDGDEGIDRAALAALSKAPPQRTELASGSAADARGKSSTQAAERAAQGAVAAAAAQQRDAVGSARPSAAARWIGPLILGFAIGVPVGGWLFSGAATGGPAGEIVGHEASPGASDPVTALAANQAPQGTTARDEPAAPAAAEPAPMVPAAAEPALAAAEPEPARAPPAAAEPARAAPSSAAPHAVPSGPSGPSAASVRAQAASAKPQPTAAVSQAADSTAQAAAPSPQPKLAPAPSPAPAAVGARDARSVDTLLDQALSQRKPAPPPMVLTPDETVPLAPSREEVKRAMTVLLPAIRGCATGQSGLATIGIVVNSDGKVASADVTGAPFEGAPSGRCIAGVVRRAKFPRFQQESFRVQFPFQIQ